MAEIIMNRRGAPCIRRGRYAPVSTSSDMATVMMIAMMMAAQNGNPKEAMA